MADKHVFSSPDGLVLASLKGSVALNPTLRLHPSSRTVYTARPDPSVHIAVVSGGGAGHEPAHAGFTGRGMLTASVSGDIFASPSAKQILNAVLLAAFAGLPPPSDPKTARPRDVLVIINNYTGDRLNFGLAIERARARYPNLNIASVLNADDVSLLPQAATNDGQEQPIVGPRGLAGNILVCKVLGAYTTFGAKGISTESQQPTFVRAKRLGDALVANLRSIGAALGHCHVPGRNAHSGTEIIEPGLIELGLGLHNEPGVRRAPLSSPTWLVSEMIKMIRSSGSGWMGSEVSRNGTVFGPAEEWIRPGDATILFLNNLGGISQLEMGAILEIVRNELATHGIFAVRIYSAPFMTSLNAPGFSISLVNVTRVHALVNHQTPGEEPIDILALLDAPTDAHSWIATRKWVPEPQRIADEELEAEETLQAISRVSAGVPSSNPLVAFTSQPWEALGFTPSEVERGIRGACNALLGAEGELTKFDTAFGDGDCGETFSRGARSVLSGLDTGILNVRASSPAAFLERVGELVEESMGGTIGAIFSIFFAAWSTALCTGPSTDPALVKVSALRKALSALSAHTPARPGDRTIVDALAPLCAPEVPQVAATDRNVLLEYTVRAVKEAAESTRHMRARFGRAAYVGRGGESEASVATEEFPDPGAWGLAALVDGFVRGVQDRQSCTG
ncbi:DAK1 DegV-like protein [Pisolithus tinctorius]|nr:DAK1 DegV-like protein [Pisolithus tinctorius]